MTRFHIPRALLATAAICSIAALTACSSSTIESGGQNTDSHRLRGHVVGVADGDTITVRTRAGERVKVRLLAIDTPESYATRDGYTECGGDEAKEALQALVERSPRVTLTTDPSQDEQDRYGRLLAYVAPAGGGQSFQAALVKAGWAEVYRFDEDQPPRRADQLDQLAEAARNADAGVWRSCGGFHRREGEER